MQRGFFNIVEHNGIGVSIIGFVTVLITLIILGIIVSQMPNIVLAQEKLARLIFRKDQKKQPPVTTTPLSPKLASTLQVLDIASLNTTYRKLAAEFKESFLLADLYALARKNDLEHPYLSVNALRDAGKIIPAPNAEQSGLFIYKA